MNVGGCQSGNIMHKLKQTAYTNLLRLGWLYKSACIIARWIPFVVRIEANKNVNWYLTLLLRGDMKGESGCISAFIADVYAAHVENMSCNTNASQQFVLYAGYVSTKWTALFSTWANAKNHCRSLLGIHACFFYFGMMHALFCFGMKRLLPSSYSKPKQKRWQGCFETTQGLALMHQHKPAKPVFDWAARLHHSWQRAAAPAVGSSATAQSTIWGC